MAFPEGRPDELAGACALHITWEDLGEIRSLVVDPKFQGQDLGYRLVEACLHEARELGLRRIFVLTYIPDYFERFGFKHIKKTELPQKIWADCFKCIKFPDCDEVAMTRQV